MRNNRILLLLLTGMIVFSSCRTIRELKSLSKCQFRIQSIRNTRLAGINIQNLRSYTDLSFTQGAKVTAAYLSGNLPLQFTMDVQVKNPNAELAALNRLDWIAMFDQTELLEGTVSKRVAVEPNGGVATIPLSISCNVRKVLDRLKKDKALNSGFELADEQNRPRRIALRLKPSITVGKKGKSIPYPGYITVKKDFVSN